MRDQGDGDFQDCFCKGLAKADSPSSVERQPREGVALLSTRSARKWVSGVETIRQELIRSLPLAGVPVEAMDVDGHGSATLDNKATDFRILLKVHRRSERHNRIDPESLLDDVVQVIQFLEELQGQFVADQLIKSDTLSFRNSIKLSSESS